jgi:hypothetical protein
MAASPIALVRSTVLAPVLRFLDQEGAPYEPVFEAVKLSPRPIERPNDLFALAQGFALLDDGMTSASSQQTPSRFTISVSLASPLRGPKPFQGAPHAA